MSSAILYLAIVAIWAVFLVPAWVRRPHAHPAAEEAGDDAQEHAADEIAADEDRSGAQDDADLGEIAGIDALGAAEGRDQEYRDEVPNYAGGGPAPGSRAEGGSDVRRHAPAPSQTREQMLRARRRMLTIMTVMTVLLGGFAVLGAVQWWICVPPAGMLVLYVLLLREIAMADAELASKRQAWLARTAREAERHEQEAWAEHEARQASSGGPGAQIIDISARVGDQLYDQYADAAVRAVGD